MRRTAGWIVVAAVLAVAWPAAAQEAPAGAGAVAAQEESGAGYLPYSDPDPLEGVSLWGALARTVVALGLVLALLGGTLVVLRRIVPGAGGGGGMPLVRVLGRVPLSPKQTLYVVHVPGRVLIVGSGGGQLSALSEITDPDEVARLVQSAGGGAVLSGGGFGGLLQRSLQATGTGVAHAAAGPEDAGLDAIRRQIANLRRMAGSGRR